MDLGMKCKRVLVQGASTGLGFAIAKMFVEEGAKVAICSRNEENLAKAKEQIPELETFVCNLDEKGSSTKLIDDVVKTFGGIDVLVINTGGPPKGVFHDLSMQDWEEGFHRLLLSSVESIHSALKYMKPQRWGRIIISTSTAAKQPIWGLTTSTVYRSGLLGLMKTLSQEIACENITINALMPGFTETERLKKFGVSNEDLLKDVPLGRFGKPEELAALAVFLGSERAAYITGQAIACDGGLIKGL